MAPTYAQQADMEAYSEGWVTDNSAALDRLLERAERDIDSIVGIWPRDPTTGLKFIPSNLMIYQRAALSRATCAQAEYRFRMGDDFMSRAQHIKAQGPDFSVEGRLSYIGPKVWAELEGTGLLKLSTSVGAGASRPPWYDLVYNDTSWDYDPPPRPTQQ